MAENYLPGWEGAKMALYETEVIAPALPFYAPIACITGRSETNDTNTTEKVNVCTEGKPETRANSVTRTVSINGEVVDTNSLDFLRKKQDSLAEQTFKVYRGAGETLPFYFKGIITALAADYPTGEGEDATFSMNIAINGDYTDTDPMV